MEDDSVDASKPKPITGSPSVMDDTTFKIVVFGYLATTFPLGYNIYNYDQSSPPGDLKYAIIAYALVVLAAVILVLVNYPPGDATSRHTIAMLLASFALFCCGIGSIAMNYGPNYFVHPTSAIAFILVNISAFLFLIGRV